MKHVFLIENNETLRTLLKLNMMKNIGCNVIPINNAIEAISFLETDSNIDLIICRDQVETERTAVILTGFLKNIKSSTPVLVLGDLVSDYSHITSLDAKEPWSSIVLKAGGLLGVEVKLDENRNVAEYAPVGINYFLNYSDTCLGFDIYIRVKKGDEFSYIKRFHADDQLQGAEIAKYKESGLRNFYIIKDQFKSFVDFSTSKLAQKLKNSKLERLDRIKLNSDAYTLTGERLLGLGIDSNTIELVESSVASMENSLKEKNALTDYLNLLKSNKNSYGYSHSFLCCLILHKISNNFDWCTSKIKEKLTFISYFHDISLNEELVKYNSADDINNSTLGDYEKVLVSNHAQLSANIVNAFDFIPEGVGAIIREHHGAKNGIGFQDTLSIALSPVSMMFIVVEDFVGHFLSFEDFPSKEEMDTLFATLKLKYSKVTYEQTVSALSTMVYSNFK